MRRISLPVLLVAAWLLPDCAARADDWPQWLGPQRDGVWRETGILDKFPEGGPRVRWRAPVGLGYAGPAVGDGRVYVPERQVAEGAKNPSGPFEVKTVPGIERLLCLDDKDGHLVWKHEYDCPYEISYPYGPRATPAVQSGKVYHLGAMGHFFCLDAASGKPVWSKLLTKDYQTKVPFWGFSASPLVDGDKVICLAGGTDTAVVAFQKDTGKELWRALSADEIGYAPPVIVDVGGTRQLIIWLPQSVNGLDPETGKVYWSHKFSVKANLSISTPRLDKDELLLSSFYNGSRLLKLGSGEPKVIWKGQGKGEFPQQTDTLHSIMSTPFIKDGYIYGVCSFGELRCLKEATGERVWESLKATGSRDKPDERWANAFLVEQGDRFFLFNEKGDLIIARLTPKGYEEISRAHVIEPTGKAGTGTGPGRSIVWTHPAFANKSVYVRNDKEIVCLSLAAGN
jgi:outer membrane protein assembly factor BamB